LAVLLFVTGALAQVAGELAGLRARLEQGDFISVIPRLEAHLRAKPGDGEARFLLGRAYYLAGGVVNIGRAADQLQLAVRAGQPKLEVYWQLGLVQAAQGKVQLALSNLRVAANGDVRASSQREAYRFAMDWGAVAWRGGDLRQALEAYGRAARVDAAQPFAWLNQGVIYLALNEPERAEPVLTRSVTAFSLTYPKHPAFSEAQYSRGRALELLGRYDGARSAYRAALALNPNLKVARDALDGLSVR
jgi:tetratricopeptide (TPR) repeat protein